jgi:hypothetical protein
MKSRYHWNGKMYEKAKVESIQRKNKCMKKPEWGTFREKAMQSSQNYFITAY